MATSSDYAIVCEVLRKMDVEENYKPSDYEYKLVAGLLAKEEKQLTKRPKSGKDSFNTEW